MTILWIVLYLVVGYALMALRVYLDARAGEYIVTEDVMSWLLWLIWPLAFVALWLENARLPNPFVWVVRLAIPALTSERLQQLVRQRRANRRK